MNDNILAQQIREAAIACGFDDCGIISLDHLEGYRIHLKERIHKAPSSAPFYKAIEGLTDTEKRFPWAKAMVVCTDWYGKYRFPKELQGKYFLSGGLFG